MRQEYHEVVYGRNDDDKEEGEGLLKWIEEEIQEEYYRESEKEVITYVNSLYEGDEMRKGKFPAIQIYPEGDEFERIDEGLLMHETTVDVIVTTKGPREEAFKESSKMASELYALLMGVVPNLEMIKDAPVRGDIVYSWEGFHRKKHRNLTMSHSKISVTYRWRSGYG